MREKELRIALVCFGGVSLAVYMHGICREILKAVRASSALHRIKDRGRRAHAAFADDNDPGDPECDTEQEYFELLQDIGGRIELRVVVDILAGASAGGINATLLARALSHDLPTRALRELWLDNADVTVLLAPEARARSWSKWVLQPFIWGAAAAGLFEARDGEVRRKLSLLLRSRWFKPPFSGSGMTGLMYDAAAAMGTPRTRSASLLPSGQDLDLFVTLTDYYGYQKLVPLHDPPVVHELEHRHVLHFRYRRRPGGEVESDFDDDNLPALAFAARATSSYPGGFPPARLAETDALVASRGLSWPRRKQFVARNFERHLRAGVEPATVAFIDGGVLNNRPFREAISAIHGRPAHREVDRRLVYIDADPAAAAPGGGGRMPGFFSTLKGALSDLPSAQPIGNELQWVTDLNARIRGIRSVIEGARQEVSDLVGDIIDKPLDRPLSADDIRAWREEANARVAREAGFAHEGYVRLKLASVRGYVARMMVTLGGHALHSPLAHAIDEVVDVWAEHRGIVHTKAGSEVLKRENSSTLNLRSFLDFFRGLGKPGGEARGRDAGAVEVPPWAGFLLTFDVDYRRRRLHFLIEGQNRLYRFIDEERFGGFNSAAVDRLKQEFYLRLDVLNRCEERATFTSALQLMAARAFPAELSAAQTRDVGAWARRFIAADGYAEDLDRVVEALGREIDLDAGTRGVDELLAALDPGEWPPEARREVLVNYLGFPFWDVLTFSVTAGRDAGERHEVRVDRISPQDVRTLEGFAAGSLKGTGFDYFAGFFSRRYRENDYLLGRLHGFDRLVDIICDAAGGVDDAAALKQRGFQRILDAEEPHLVHSGELIARLRRQVARMGGPQRE